MKKALNPEALRAAIEASPLSYRALARAALCGKNLPGRLIAGRPTEDAAAARIAKALGQPLDELFVDAVSSTEQHLSKQEAAA